MSIVTQCSTCPGNRILKVRNMKCLFCKQELNTASNFCTKCGKGVTIISAEVNGCSGFLNGVKCNYPISASNKFCPRCGMKDEKEIDSEKLVQSTDDETKDSDELAQSLGSQDLRTSKLEDDETNDSDELAQSLGSQDLRTSKLEDILQMLEQKSKEEVMKDLKHSLENSDKETLNFGITGITAVGKSSFINLLLDLKPDDQCYAEVGSGDTTTKVTLYRHPVYKNFTISDMPGFGSVEMPKDKFLKVVNLSDYDFFFIFIDIVFKEDDAWIAGKLLQRKIPFCFVQAKLDEHVAREQKNDKRITEDQAVQKLREKLTPSLNKKTEFKGAELFLISNIKTKCYLGDIVALVEKIASALPDGKAEAFLFFLPILAPETIEMKFNELRKRVAITAVLAGLMGVTGVVGFLVTLNPEIVVKELKKYVSVFGLDKDFVPKVPGLKNPFSRGVVRDSSDWNQIITGDLKSMVKFGVLATTSSLPVLLPIVGSVISAGAHFGIIHTFLMQHLEELRDDAMTVHRHFNVL